MTPKEKAKDLVDSYYKLAESIDWTDDATKQKASDLNDELGSDVLIYWNELAKQSALIAVDEIIKALSEDINPLVNYWYDVKKEIELL